MKLFKRIKQLDKKNKRKLLILTILLVVILASGVSYAYYLFGISQENENIVSSSCFKLTYKDKDDIKLDNAIPVEESYAINEMPYEFTVKNVCNTATSYQVNLETLNSSTLDTIYIRSKLDEDNSYILGELGNVTTFVNNNVKESRKLINGTLLKDEEITFKLRVWLDKETTLEEANAKSWSGKVVVVGTINKYDKKINLHLNGGRAREERLLVKAGKEIGVLPYAEKEGYTLTGWYSDEELTNDVTSETIVTEDLTDMWAKWERTIDTSLLKIGDIVNYSVEGNEGTISEWLVIKEGENPELVAKTAPENQFTLTGKDGILSGIYYLNKEALSYATNLNIVKTARSFGYSNQIESCFNEYNCPDDDGHVEDMTLVSNAMTNLVPSGASKTRYYNAAGVDVSYWVASRFGSDMRYYNKTTFGARNWAKLGSNNSVSFALRPIITLQSVVKLKETENQNIYEIVENSIGKQYLVNFDVNGGNELSEDEQNKMVTYNDVYGYLPTPIRHGYQFDGWYTDPSSGDKKISSTIVMINNDETLYAHWSSLPTPSSLQIGERVNYSITGNEGEIASWIVIKEGVEPELVALTAPSGTYTLTGQEGYLNSIYLLNQEALSYATNTNIIKSARSFGYTDQVERCVDISTCSTDTGYTVDNQLLKTAKVAQDGSTARYFDINGTGVNYWVASRKSNANYQVRYYNNSNCSPNYYQSLYSSNTERSYSYTIRPIITLQSNIRLIKTYTEGIYEIEE